MTTLFTRARTLAEGIEETRQTLRDEHFPHDEGLRIYEALHETLRQMGVQAESFLKWAGMFPNQELSDAHQTHLRMLEITLKSIKEALG